MTFAGIDLLWYHQKPEVLYGSYYDNISMRTISRHTKEKANTFTAKLHGSQGFDWKQLKVVHHYLILITTIRCCYKMWCFDIQAGL